MIVTAGFIALVIVRISGDKGRNHHLAGRSDGIISPYYPEGKRDRLPKGIEKMLRMYLLQIWFNLSEPAAEDAIYDRCSIRKFMGINFMTESVPDETTLCKFHHLLEEHGLNRLFFETVNRVLEETGTVLLTGFCTNW